MSMPKDDNAIYDEHMKRRRAAMAAFETAKRRAIVQTRRARGEAPYAQEQQDQRRARAIDIDTQRQLGYQDGAGLYDSFIGPPPPPRKEQPPDEPKDLEQASPNKWSKLMAAGMPSQTTPPQNTPSRLTLPVPGKAQFPSGAPLSEQGKRNLENMGKPQSTQTIGSRDWLTPDEAVRQLIDQHDKTEQKPDGGMLEWSGQDGGMMVSNEITPKQENKFNKFVRGYDLDSGRYVIFPLQDGSYGLTYLENWKTLQRALEKNVDQFKTLDQAKYAAQQYAKSAINDEIAKDWQYEFEHLERVADWYGKASPEDITGVGMPTVRGVAPPPIYTPQLLRGGAIESALNGDYLKSAYQLAMSALQAPQSVLMNAGGAVVNAAAGKPITLTPDMTFRDYAKTVQLATGAKESLSEQLDKAGLLGAIGNFTLEVLTDPSNYVAGGIIYDTFKIKGLLTPANLQLVKDTATGAKSYMINPNASWLQPATAKEMARYEKQWAKEASQFDQLGGIKGAGLPDGMATQPGQAYRSLPKFVNTPDAVTPPAGSRKLPPPVGAAEGKIGNGANIIPGQWGVRPGAGAAGAGKTGKIITEVKYTPSSGAILKANPNKTTTILGSFDKDMKNIVNEMGNVKSTDFGARKGGFNVLNVPDEMYKTADQFWNEVNVKWLDEAIARGDDFVLATKPTGRAISYIDLNTGKEIITGFGREYNYLLGNGYVYDALTNMMIKK